MPNLDETFERMIPRTHQRVDPNKHWEPIEWDDLRAGDIFRRMSAVDTYWRILSEVNSPGQSYHFFVQKLEAGWIKPEFKDGQNRPGL